MKLFNRICVLVLAGTLLFPNNCIWAASQIVTAGQTRDVGQEDEFISVGVQNNISTKTLGDQQFSEDDWMKYFQNMGYFNRQGLYRQWITYFKENRFYQADLNENAYFSTGYDSYDKKYKNLNLTWAFDIPPLNGEFYGFHSENNFWDRNDIPITYEETTGKVLEKANHTVGSKGELHGVYSMNTTLLEHPKATITIKYQDPYGNEIDESNFDEVKDTIPDGVKAEFRVAGDQELDNSLEKFSLPKNPGTYSLWDLEDKENNFIFDDYAFIKNTPTLSVVDKDNINIVGDSIWKQDIDTKGKRLKSIKASYKPKEGGEVDIQVMPKIMEVPEDKATQPAPKGYVRLTLDANGTTIGNKAVQGKIVGGKYDNKDKAYLDVRYDTKWNDSDLIQELRSIVAKGNGGETQNEANPWKAEGMDGLFFLKIKDSVSEKTLKADYSATQAIIPKEDAPENPGDNYVTLTLHGTSKTDKKDRGDGVMHRDKDGSDESKGNQVNFWLRKQTSVDISDIAKIKEATGGYYPKANSKSMTFEAWHTDEVVTADNILGSMDEQGKYTGTLYAGDRDVNLYAAYKENKSAKPTDVKAMNQNIEKDGIVTDKAKDTTTVTGKAPAESTVIIKNAAGQEIGKVEKVPANGEFTVEVKKQADGAVITATAIEKGKTENEVSDPAEATVIRDANNNGKDDEKEKIDFAKVNKISIIQQPKLEYPITEKDGKKPLDLKQLLVEVSDGANKARLTAEELLKEELGNKKVFTLELVQPGSPEDTVKATITDMEQMPELAIANNGNKVHIALAAKANVKTETEALQVFQDLNNDGKPDGNETDAPVNLKALNKGNDAFTTITGKAKKDEVIKVYGTDGKIMTTDPATVTVTNDDGTFTVTVANNGAALDVGTNVLVTAQAKAKNESNRTPAIVQKDSDGNGIADVDETTPEPKVVARNIGEKPEKTTVEIETVKNAKVTIEYKVGSETKTIDATADGYGKVTKEIKPKLDAGTEVKVTVKDGEKQPTEKTVNVFDDLDGNGVDDSKDKTPMPSILSARNVEEEKEGTKSVNTKVKVKALLGSTITIKDENGKVISDAVEVPAKGTDKYNEVEITLKEKQDAGKKVQAIAKLGERQDSDPAESIVFDDLDGDGKPDGQGKVDFANIVDMRIASDPKTMSYAVKTETEETALKLDGLTVYVKDKNGNSGIYQYGAEANKVNGIQFEELKGNANFKLELADAKGENPKVIADGTTLTKANDTNKIKVSLVKNANKNDTTGPLNVFVDANGNGIDDNKEKIDLTKVTSMKVISQPELNYPITVKDNGKKNIDLTKMVVAVSDGVTTANYTAQQLLDAKVGEDKAFKLELVKGTAEAEPTTKDITSVNGIELTTANDGNKVQISKASDANVKTETEALQVFQDLDNDGNPDDKQTPAPKDLKALNVKDEAFTTITGKAQPGDTLKVYGEDKKEITVKEGDVTIDKNGNFTIKVSKDGAALPKDSLVFVTAQADKKDESPRTPVVVKTDADGNGFADKDEKSAKAENVKALNQNKVDPQTKKVTNEPKDTTTVTGKAPKGSTVIIKNEAGNEIGKVDKVGDNGEFTAEVTKQKDGDKVQVVVTEPGKKDSDPEPATVVRDANNDGIDDSEFSDKPSIVTPVKNGDTTVEVTGKEGAKAYVVITDKNGNETKTPETALTKGQDGKIKITVPELKDGQTIKVVQQDGDKKPVESDPVVVKPNTTGDNLENNITKAVEKAGQLIDDPNSTANPKDKIRKNLDQNSSTDKELQDALKEAEEAKEKANKVDQNGKQIPENTQKDVDYANDRLKKALEEKEKYDKAKKAVEEAKTEWNKIKDKPSKEGDPAPTAEEYKQVQDKINEAQKTIDELNSTNGTSTNTDKPKLQKELDKIYLDKVIKQADEKLKEKGLDDTDKGKLEKAVNTAKDDQNKLQDTNANNDPDHGKISQDIKAIEDALNPKGKTADPTIYSVKVGATKITGTATPGAEVTVKVGDKELGKVTASSIGGAWSISTDALKDKEVIKVVAQESGKSQSKEVTQSVGLDLDKIKETKKIADTLVEEAKKEGNWKPEDDNTQDPPVLADPYDKNLKEKMKTATEIINKAEDTNVTDKPSQEVIDKAEKELRDALDEKEADKAVDNAKDKVLDPNASDEDKTNAINDAQEKIDKIPGSTDPSAPDHNPIKKDLQDKLDLIKKIKEGEDRLKQDDIKNKPKKDVQDLKEAIDNGKKALDSKDSKTITEATRTIEKAIDQINKERIVVGVDSLARGIKTLEIRTSVPEAKVVIKIDGVKIDTITTSSFGTFSKGLLEGLKEDQEVVLEASKPGYNDGSFDDTVN